MIQTPIVSSLWLKENLNDPDLVLLDASQNTNKAGKKPDQNKLQIPGSRLFDLSGEFSLQSSDLPNMLPSPEQFEIACRSLGINNSSKIVVYDNLGIYFSPRVWWMFKVMGHDQVSVLDGGLPNWQALDFETEVKNNINFDKGDFIARFQNDRLVDYEFVQQNIETQACILVDARSSNRFLGLAPEPRIGISSGHIPQSVNLPFEEVLDDGKFKSKQELKQLFSGLELDNRPIIFSCGSGLTACIILLAFQLIRTNETLLYDGSWTDWALRTQSN